MARAEYLGTPQDKSFLQIEITLLLQRVGLKKRLAQANDLTGEEKAQLARDFAERRSAGEHDADLGPRTTALANRIFDDLRSKDPMKRTDAQLCIQSHQQAWADGSGICTSTGPSRSNS